MMDRDEMYAEVVEFVEQHTGRKLFDFQKCILHAWCHGQIVSTPRCCGRSMLANAFGRYVAQKLDKNGTDTTPQVKIDARVTVDTGLTAEPFSD